MLNPPRIAIDLTRVDRMGPGFGLFRYAVDLVQGLAQIASDASFVLIGSKAAPAPELAPLLAEQPAVWRYVQFVPSPRRGGALRDQVPYARLLRRERATLFHAPYLFAPILAPCPTVMTVHDLIWETFPEHARAARGLPWRLHRWAARRRATRLIAISAATAADIETRWAVSREKVTVVPHGTSFGSAMPATIREPVSPALRALDAGDRVIATPFNLEPHKNISALLRAVAELRPACPRIRVVAFGRAGCTGDREARFEQELQALRIESLIIRCGMLDDADLAWLYGRADVVALPSLSEGFALPALEAMAVGGRVVASNAPAMRELVGDAGVLVETRGTGGPLAAAIGDLLQNPTRRSALALRAKERAREFTTARMARATWDVYRQALDARSTASATTFGA